MRFRRWYAEDIAAMIECYSETGKWVVAGAMFGVSGEYVRSTVANALNRGFDAYPKRSK